MVLPPGQRAVQGFPRFGVELDRPPPVPPTDMTIEISGELARHVSLRPEDLADLPRRRVDAALHCVAGWSAVGLGWDGVPFADALPAADRARARRRCTRPLSRLRRSRRLPLHRRGRGRPGRRRADRRPARRSASDPRARCAGAAGEPGPVRVRQHQAPVPDRAAPVRTGQPVPLDGRASSGRCAPSARTEGLGSGAKNATATSLPGSSGRSTVGWCRSRRRRLGESDQSGTSVGAT